MAATDAGRAIRNAPYRVFFTVRDSSGAYITGAATDPEICKDSATWEEAAQASGTEIAGPGSQGTYHVDLTTAECTVTNSLLVHLKSAAGVPAWKEIEFEPCLESGVALSGTSTSITLRTGANSNDDIYNGASIEIVRGTGQGQVRTITDYVGSTKVATVDRAWIINPGSTTVYKITAPPSPAMTQAAGTVDANMSMISGDSVAADNLEALFENGIETSSIDDAAPTTTSFIGAAGLSSIDDFYNGAQLVFQTDDEPGYTARVSDYVGSTRTFTLSAALPFTPGNGDKFVLIGRAI